MLQVAESWLSRCPRYARVMGYLDEVTAIAARFRQAGDDWRPHLERSKQVIRQAIAQCEPRRKAVVFGAGGLHDVPIDDLRQAFGQVYLVDMVHPLAVRWQRRNWPNVQLVCADATAVAEQVFELGGSGAALPESRPSLFLDDPAVDLVVSVNLLSQLPYTPLRYLRRWNRYTEAQLEEFARRLIEAHLDYLRRFRGTVCLIADETYLYYDREDRLVETASALRGVPLPWPGEDWMWRLVRREQNDGKTSIFHKVRGMIRPPLRIVV